MKNYNTFSSNYLNNKLSFNSMKYTVNELVTDLESLSFSIPKEPIIVDQSFINLPLIKNIQYTNGVNRVKIQQDFNQVGVLKTSLGKQLKPILYNLSNLKFDKLYYYSKMCWYLSGFDNNYSYMSSVSGTTNFDNIQHPICNIFLQKLLPNVINDQVAIVKMQANIKAVDFIKSSLPNDFDVFIQRKKEVLIDKLTHYIITQIVTLTPTYSNYIFTEVKKIIADEFENLPLFTTKLNKEAVINLIYNQQLNELCLNVINGDILNLPIASDGLFLQFKEEWLQSNIFTGTYPSCIEILNGYTKIFNNNIANEVLVLNEDLVVKLQAIIGQFKNNPEFFINAFYIVFNQAIPILKENYSSIFFPPNFIKDMLKLILDNLNPKLKLTNFREREKDLIESILNKYLLSVINTYIYRETFTNFLLSLLHKLNKYNLQSNLYFYPVQQYFKLLLTQNIVNGELFSNTHKEFQNLYSSIEKSDDESDITVKINKLYNYSKFDIDYFTDELFNFFFSSVTYNITESLLTTYRV